MDEPRTHAIVALDQPRRHTASPGESVEDEPAASEEIDPALGLLLHYHVPEHLEGKVQPGHLVVVPLRGSPSSGVVVGMANSSPVAPTQPVVRLLDSRPLISPPMLCLGRWIAGYYRCTLWQALAPMLPPGAARRAITTIGLAPAATEPPDADEADPLINALGRRQRQVVSLLRGAPKSTLTISKLKRRYSGAPSGLSATLLDLERKGLVTRHTELPGPRSRAKQERTIRLTTSPEAASEALRGASRRAPLQAAALAWLLKQSGQSPRVSGQSSVTGEIHNPHSAFRNEEGWLLLRDLYLHTGATAATVSALQRKGLVEAAERTVHRAPVPATAASHKDEPPPLTPAQAAAWREIAEALRAAVSRQSSVVSRTEGERRLVTDREPASEQSAGSWASPNSGNPQSAIKGAFLLHGVTGSGKTEIYLRAIGMALRLGRQAIVLVPEISLTPQAVHRFASRFPGRVALLHSQLSPGQQFDEWRRIRDGQADIVIGSRSAVFAPLPRLGLIVVDEEHEWAYKQQDFPPRYHARDVALKRAELTGSVVVLGSATPDLATYHAAQTGKFRLLSLPTRVGRRRSRGGSEWTTELPMPQMQVVDMRAELRTGNGSIFSRSLQSALRETLERKEQAILYLNRRGSNSFILCRECGYVPLCRRCDVPLVYHEAVYGLLCHRCNAFSLAPHECPRCGSERIRGLGIGTQKVVDEVVALFPRARVLRWDRDTASRQGHGGHANMMDLFTRGEADVLVGTQMIAKGLDIDRVTLVGVISADTGLYLPDFRAPERSLQLLMQVAGRAGRRTETTHSRVVVQTFNPDHYAIQAAAQYDYKGFYSGEIRFRAEHGYPPYGRLVRLVYSSTSNAQCERQGYALAHYLSRKAEDILASGIARDLDVLGPTPCFVHKVRGRYRWQVLVRGERDAVATLLNRLDPGPGWSVDVDPMSLL